MVGSNPAASCVVWECRWPTRVHSACSNSPVDCHRLQGFTGRLPATSTRRALPTLRELRATLCRALELVEMIEALLEPVDPASEGR